MASTNLALIIAETPQIIANMARLEAKKKALVLLCHQCENLNQQEMTFKFLCVLLFCFHMSFEQKYKNAIIITQKNVLSLFLSTNV